MMSPDSIFPVFSIFSNNLSLDTRFILFSIADEPMFSLLKLGYNFQHQFYIPAISSKFSKNDKSRHSDSSMADENSCSCCPSSNSKSSVIAAI